MELSFAIKEVSVKAPKINSLSEFKACLELGVLPNDAPMPKVTTLGMMTARRLNSGSRLAADLAAEIFKGYPDIEAAVFVSRHGELERNFSILSNLASQQEVSPTDFTMSVHNAAGAAATIASQKALPVSSLAAGSESFIQGLIEAVLFLNEGCQKVLLVDFEGRIPEFYRSYLPANAVNFPYAAALVLSPGADFMLKAGGDFSDGVDLINAPEIAAFEFVKFYLGQQSLLSFRAPSNCYEIVRL